MTRKFLLSVTGSGAAAALAAVVVLSVAPGEQSGLAPTLSSSSGPEATSEGIKVHGHWTIEVRDPDGSLVSRREFENALASPGSFGLGEILTRRKSVGSWFIWVHNTVDANRPCLDSSSNPAACTISESTHTGTSPQLFKNLTLAFPAFITSGPHELVLSGNATAQRDASINLIQTGMGQCDGTISPSACVTLGATHFTVASLATPQPVQTGQTILVTVVISFS